MFDADWSGIRGNLQDAVRDWLGNMSFSHFFTFNYNRTTTPAAALKKIKEFHARWDRKVLGKDFNLLPAAERSLLIGFPEHHESNLHYHALVRLAASKAVRANPYVHAPKIWNQLVPSGQLYIPLLTTPSGFEAAVTSGHIPEPHVQRIANYITKDIKKRRNYDGFFTSHEFLNG